MGSSVHNVKTNRPALRSAMRPLILLLGCMQMRAQSVQVLPSPPSADGTAAFQIMMVSRADKPVSTLQWRLSATNGVEFAEENIKTGSSAQEAQKSLTCRRAQGSSDSVCILAGGT